MKWSEIRKSHPDQFVLLEDIQEESISEHRSRILGGTVVCTSKDIKDIMKSYQDYKLMGKNVIYSLPGTPDDFIIENVSFMGILR